MVDTGIWGYVILAGVVLLVIYLFPKIIHRAPEAAETIGSFQEHIKIGRLRAQAELKKVEQELKGQT